MQILFNHTIKKSIVLRGVERLIFPPAGNFYPFDAEQIEFVRRRKPPMRHFLAGEKVSVAPFDS